MRYSLSRIFYCLVILLSPVFLLAETVSLNATRYRLHIVNNAEQPAQKLLPADVTPLPAGLYQRWTAYDAEILCDFDLSVIPTDATITNVSF